MKLKFLNTAFAGLILSLSCLVSTANAGLILEDSTVVDTSGQTYSQIFDVTGFENYTNLVFTVNARGDYGITELGEIIDFSIDDTFFGEFSLDTVGVDSYVGPTGWDDFDYIIDFSFTISDVDWNTLANDSQVNVQWNNSSRVGTNPAFYVSYTLSGTPSEPSVVDPKPVPAPTTLVIFALGMIGLASRRFKKQS